MGVKFAAKDASDVVRQTAQNRDHDETDDHRNDVAEVVAAPFSQNSTEKDSKQRAITEDSQRNRNDPHIGMHG